MKNSVSIDMTREIEKRVIVQKKAVFGPRFQAGYVSEVLMSEMMHPASMQTK